MKTKWVVSDDEMIFGIFDTEADAEEFIFSMAEEMAYDNYVEEVMLGTGGVAMTTEQYIQTHAAMKNFDDCWILDSATNRWTRVNRQTVYSYILDCALDTMFIDEVYHYSY